MSKNEMVVKHVGNYGARVSTFELWEKFGYTEHRFFKRIIAENLPAFEEDGFLPLERQKPKRIKGGRPDESYLLNEQQFITLVMLAKNTPEAKDFKLQVKREFFRMREELQALKSHQSTDQWQAARLEGKAHRRSETDAIKAFVEYAQKQGSGSADRYYEALTKMENAALFVVAGKYPNLRNIMSSAQLFQIGCADQIIVKALKSGMEQGMPYKDIFQVAKAEVMKFGAIMGQSEIISKQLEDLT